MNKKFSLMMAMILCALVAQAQDVPPDTTWESDPLDVLESKPSEEKGASVPEFKEIAEPGKETAESQEAPPPEVTEPAASEVATPEPLVAEPAATSISAPATGNSDPDYVREAEFHRIYKNYNEQPTAVEVWEKAVSGRPAEVYKVQKGDTLWGISTTFFGDPNFWPKIWSLNKGEILNPHEINPAMNVQFFPGTADEAPTLDLAVAVPVKAPLVEEEGEAKAETPARTHDLVQLPPPRKRAPLLKTLPASLPQHKPGQLRESELEFQIVPRGTGFPKALEYLQYYVADGPVSGVGVVTETDLEMRTAGENQVIYVRLNGTAGKEFVAQKNLNTVIDPQDKKRKAQMIEVQGEVEILEKVNEQENIFRAVVKKSIQPVEVGAILTPGRLAFVDPSATAVVQGVGARIIGGQFDTKRSLFGSNTLVFLNAGSSQGLQEGQTLMIFADQRVRNKKTGALMNDRSIGQVKIVRLSPGFATAYVVKATDDIAVGDYVGKALTQAANHAPAVVEEPAADTGGAEAEFEEDFESSPADVPADSGEAVPDGGSEDSDLDF